MKVSDIISELENIAPPDLADDGDPIGLQVGDLDNQVKRIAVGVDSSQSVVENAIEFGADILVTHHPLIYKPLGSVTFSDPVAGRVTRLIKHGCAHFAMHTNFDSVPGGINDVLASLLGVTETLPLTERKKDKIYKIAVFVPEEALVDVRNAMANAGAGIIGQYTHCSFCTKGTGSFVPLATATPYIGSVGKLEEVEEYRLEMVCVGSWLDAVLEDMLEKHPYDEVAYDVYELANDPVIYGYGRVGTLDENISLGEFYDSVVRKLDVRFPKVFGALDKRISRVALCGGGGAPLYHEAASACAEVYVTGDWKHHDIQAALDLGLAVIDAGHFETEKPGVVSLVERLRAIYADRKVAVEYVE